MIILWYLKSQYRVSLLGAFANVNFTSKFKSKTYRIIYLKNGVILMKNFTVKILIFVTFLFISTAQSSEIKKTITSPHPTRKYLFINPLNHRQVSGKSGQMASPWLKKEIDNGRKLSEFLNPEHPRYQMYKEKYEFEKEAKDDAVTN